MKDHQDRAGKRCEACQAEAYVAATVVKGSPDVVVCPACSHVADRWLSQDEVEAIREARVAEFIQDKAHAAIQEWIEMPKDGEPMEPRGAPMMTTESYDGLMVVMEKLLRDSWGPLADVAGEMATQDAQWGAQNHGMPWWLAILGEEYGEACAACLNDDLAHPGDEFEAIIAEGGNLVTFEPPPQRYAKLRHELVQVAAVAAQIVHRIDGIEQLAKDQERATQEAMDRLAAYVDRALERFETFGRWDDLSTARSDFLQEMAEEEQAIRLLSLSKAGRAILGERKMGPDHPLIQDAERGRLAKFLGEDTIEVEAGEPSLDDVRKSRASEAVMEVDSVDTSEEPVDDIDAIVERAAPTLFGSGAEEATDSGAEAIKKAVEILDANAVPMEDRTFVVTKEVLEQALGPEEAAELLRHLPHTAAQQPILFPELDEEPDGPTLAEETEAYLDDQETP
jgi:hypothetical protein